MGLPKGLLVPFVGVQFDSSLATSGTGAYPVQVAIIGQKTSEGTGEANKQLLVSSADEVADLAGFGSMAHRQAIKFFANNRVSTTQLILLDDADTSTAATKTITVTGAATAVGEVALLLNGDRYAAGAAVGATADEVATAIAAAITAEVNAPVTAAAVAGVVTLTAKNKGLAAGEMIVISNYYEGEVTPAGLTITVGATTDGTIDPDIQDAIDAIGDAWFTHYTAAYVDPTNLTTMQDYLLAQTSPLVQRDGMYLVGKTGTRSELITFATDGTRNCPYVGLMATSMMPNTTYEVAAAYTARCAESVAEDTAIPLHRMTLTDILPVAKSERWTLIERNQLAENGVMTLTHDLGVQSEATVTMYLKNAAGADDIAYQQQNTIYQLSYARYTFVQRILTKYPRAKLADSIERMQSNQQVMTPAVGITEAVSWFIALESQGILENISQFKDDVQCIRPDGYPNRLEWLLPPDLVNQFIVGSADMQFRLQG